MEKPIFDEVLADVKYFFLIKPSSIYMSHLSIQSKWNSPLFVQYWQENKGRNKDNYYMIINSISSTNTI